MALKEELEAHLAKFPTVPFLFIGSGIARRYLDLEDWANLLKRFAELCGSPYEYFVATANGSLPKVGTEIAKALHPLWWKKKTFAASRAAFAQTATTEESALKIEISRYLQKQSDKIPKTGPLAAELERLRKVVVDGIVTTDWDLLLDHLFPEFRVFVGQDELLFSAPQGVGEIYKIHGCCSQPNSLVVTARDYDRFKERNPYLAAKLLAIFVEHPVVFLGYSLSDPNILEILRSISSCLTTENIHQLQERLVFIQWAPDLDSYKLTQSTIVADGQHIPVVHIRTNDLLPVYDALGSTARKFPARLLRQLKEHVHKLVLTQDPHNKLFVRDIDADEELEDLEVVFGVGAIDQLRVTGYKSISRLELLADVIGNGDKYNPKAIVEDTLPDLLRHARYVPVFKYLRQAARIDDAGKVAAKGLDARVLAAAGADDTFFWPPKAYRKRQAEFSKLNHSFATFAKTHTVQDVLAYAPFLPRKVLQGAGLLTFLRKHQHLMYDAKNSLDHTQYIKLACLYDKLTYKTGK